MDVHYGMDVLYSYSSGGRNISSSGTALINDMPTPLSNDKDTWNTSLEPALLQYCT